jgi:tripartite-type tricarboxylate transporter receptor subunit TctC
VFALAVAIVLGLIQSGKLKAVAIASERRLALLPDVPTFVESGIDYRTGAWFGLLAPAGTPDTVIAALHGATVEVLRGEAVRTKISEQGGEVVANAPEQFRAFITSETDRLAAVIHNAKIQID